MLPAVRLEDRQVAQALFAKLIFYLSLTVMFQYTYMIASPSSGIAISLIYDVRFFVFLG
jgi:hypothetical protein